MTQRIKTLMMMLTFLCICLVFGLPAKTFAGAVNSSDAIKNLDINGDLRIRYEWINKDVSGEDAVDRLRQRFRLGTTFNNPDEDWKVAAGLATGPIDATSTDQTYSEQKFFDKGNISLDYAYAEHKIDCVKLIAGQQKNPFESSWLLWDTDVRPAGFTAKCAYESLFATAGYYQARYINNDIAPMGAAQLGVKMDMLTAALAYYQFGRTDEILKDLKITGVDNDYNYRIIDFYVAGKVKADEIDFKPYGQVWYNAGAKGEKGQSVLNGATGGAALDPEDAENDLGWVVGVEGKMDVFTACVDYTQIGADSCVQGLKDATFGSQLNLTDVKGFRAVLGYNMTKNSWVNVTGFFYEALKRDIPGNPRPQTWQIDLNYKF